MPSFPRDTEPKTHFVASLKIEKVERNTNPDPSARPGRVIDEVTHITLKSESLDKLKEKIAGHVALVEED